MPITLSMLSPLRYPGSKACLVDYVAAVLKDNYLDGCCLIEPYAGSAIVSIGLLDQGIISKAILVERDPLIYAFWQSVFFHTYQLTEKLFQLPITIDTWQDFQKFRACDDLSENWVVDMGLAGLFFNRTNFSGILKAGPLGGAKQESQYKIDCRFNKERLINQINTLSSFKDKVEVRFNDAITFLQNERRYLKNENCFLYVDPPYYEKGKDLYRYWYEQQDHKNLASFLKRCDTPWLVSYDDHSNIRKLYRKSNMVEIYFDYTVSGCRKGREILISNREIPPGIRDVHIVDLA